MTTVEVGKNVKAVLDLAAKACGAYERPDLEGRVQRIVGQAEDRNLNVVIVGEFKQGKSSLINALLNAKICPVDDDIATAVPTIVRYGDPKNAWAILVPESDADDSVDQEEIRREIAFEDLPLYATEQRDVEHEAPVRAVEIELPRKLLSAGLVLVDTPGVGGLGSAHATAALGALSVADAVLFVSDSSQEFTQPEMEFLAHAMSLCPVVVCLQTKTDFYPAWRKVVEINKGHLSELGHDVSILAVSSALRVEAARRNDKELNLDSGFPDLLKKLKGDIVGGADSVQRERVSGDVQEICGQLASQFEVELAVLNDPEQSSDLVDRLEEAKARSLQLRGDLAKWNITLGDGVGDLSADIDHDFRARMRKLMQEGDAAIENSDPINTWDEFEPWLVNRVSHEVISNYCLLTDRAAELSARVAEHFSLDGGRLFEQLDIRTPSQILSTVDVEEEVDLEDLSRGKSSLTILRGSYSGMLMFTVLGGMVAVAAPLLPIVAPGVGLLMGRGALKDEKKRQLAKRRGQAKNAMRRYCDEVSFQVNKDSRDTLRRVQRQLRDHYSARSEELHRSINESLKVAGDAAKTGQAERVARIRHVEAELSRISALRDSAAALSVGPAGDAS
jgi:hypothetical protein